MLKAVIERLPDPIYAKDTEGRDLFLNSAAADEIGKPIAEIVGKDNYQFFPRDAANRLKKLDVESMSRHEPIESEIRMDVRGWTRRTMLSTRFAFVGEDGEIAGVIGIERDVTEQRCAEEALRESEERANQAHFHLNHHLRGICPVGCGRPSGALQQPLQGVLRSLRRPHRSRCPPRGHESRSDPAWVGF